MARRFLIAIKAARAGSAHLRDINHPADAVTDRRRPQIADTAMTSIAPASPARLGSSSLNRSPDAPATLSRRMAALLLLAQFAAMWTAFGVLAPSIDWPASLDLAPADALPLIRDQAGPVFWGYASYFLHAVLLIPLAVVLRHTLRMAPTLGGVAVALGLLAGFAKALGIVRWLVLMPGLAAAHADPATSEAARAAIEVVYQAFNAYAGGVGEVVGVGLLAGLWTGLLSVSLLRLGALWLGLAGLVAAAGLLSTLPSVAGLESPMLLTLSGILWQLWTAALAVWHLRAR